MEDKEVLLPQTRAELDEFIEMLVTEYNLPRDDETDWSITSMIVHLPATQAYAKPSFFAHGVLRGIAQKHAYQKNKEATDKLNATRDLALAEDKKKTELSIVSNEQPLPVA